MTLNHSKSVILSRTPLSLSSSPFKPSTKSKRHGCLHDHRRLVWYSKIRCVHIMLCVDTILPWRSGIVGRRRNWHACSVGTARRWHPPGIPTRRHNWHHHHFGRRGRRCGAAGTKVSRIGETRKPVRTDPGRRNASAAVVSVERAAKGRASLSSGSGAGIAAD